MTGIPLVNTNSVNDINTSIIAIKKEMKSSGETEVNVNVNLPDTAIPVDEVTSGNMHSVTSNAVAVAINNINTYRSGEYATGRKWIDEKTIYEYILFANDASIGANTDMSLTSVLADKNIDTLIKYYGSITLPEVSRCIALPNKDINLYINTLDGTIHIENNLTSLYANNKLIIFVEYTKNN